MTAAQTLAELRAEIRALVADLRSRSVAGPPGEMAHFATVRQWVFHDLADEIERRLLGTAGARAPKPVLAVTPGEREEDD